MSDEPEITVRYRTTRKEIWRFYWQQWRRRLWIYWLAFAVAIEIAFQRSLLQFNAHDAVGGTVTVGIVWLGLLIYPQLNFKPKERVLTIDKDGVHTTIGKESGVRTWREIASILDRDDAIYIIVAKTMNAFVVPQRAFGSAAERMNFLESAKRWHTAARSG